MSDNRSGARFMISSAVAFSLMSVFVKLSARRLPIQEVVLFRALFTLVISLVMLRVTGVPVWGRRRGLLVLRGAIGYLALSCVFYSVANLPLAEAVTIQYLHPLATVLFAATFLRERLTVRIALATLLSLAGVVCVTRPLGWFGSGADAVRLFPVAVAATGAMLTACAYIVVRSLAQTEHALTIVFYFPLVAVPASVPSVLSGVVWPTGVEWLFLVGVGLFAQAGQIYLTQGLKLEPAGRATALSYLQVLFAAGWGLLFFGELPTPWTLLGALLILLGSLAVIRGPLLP